MNKKKLFITIGLITSSLTCGIVYNKIKKKNKKSITTKDMLEELLTSLIDLRKTCEDICLNLEKINIEESIIDKKDVIKEEPIIEKKEVIEEEDPIINKSEIKESYINSAIKRLSSIKFKEFICNDCSEQALIGKINIISKDFNVIQKILIETLENNDFDTFLKYLKLLDIYSIEHQLSETLNKIDIFGLDIIIKIIELKISDYIHEFEKKDIFDNSDDFLL